MALTGRTTASRGGPEVWGDLAYEAWILGTNAVGAGGASTNLTSAQSFATIAAASSLLSIDGTASYWFKTTGNKAYFAFPQFLTIQCGSPGAGTNQGTFTVTGRNQFDELVEEKIAYASGTSSTITTKTCWRYVDSISFVNNTGTDLGDDTATVSVGWKMSNNTGTFPARLPTPFKVKSTADILSVICVDIGSSSLAGIALGTALTTSQITVDVNNNSISFVTGAVTTQPTTPMKFLIVAATGTRMNR